MNQSNLDNIIAKLKEEYPFVTPQQEANVRAEYANSSENSVELEKELLGKIKDHVTEPEFIPITDFVSYHKTEDTIHIHLTPKSLMPYMKEAIIRYGKEAAREKFDGFLVSKLEESLTKVADIAISDERIKKVSATSGLVKKYQPLFEKSGFEIRLFSDQELAKIFSTKSVEEKEQFRFNADMSREKLLSKYKTESLNNNSSISKI